MTLGETAALPEEEPAPGDAAAPPDAAASGGRALSDGGTAPCGLQALRGQAAGCQACPLWEMGTQTVFGSGPDGARVMFVGEAPGYNEDKQGLPFVGPAGRLFNEALEQAGLARDEVYVTNVVKHRPWIKGGRQGKNRAPKQSEINACRPWLAQELAALRPLLVGCLGALAAKWFLGPEFKLTQQRGQWLTADARLLGSAPPRARRGMVQEAVPATPITLPADYAPHVLATVHPSFVLIQPPESYDRWRESLFADVRAIAQRLRSL